MQSSEIANLRPERANGSRGIRLGPIGSRSFEHERLELLDFGGRQDERDGCLGRLVPELMIRISLLLSLPKSPAHRLLHGSSSSILACLWGLLLRRLGLLRRTVDVLETHDLSVQSDLVHQEVGEPAPTVQLP